MKKMYIVACWSVVLLLAGACKKSETIFNPVAIREIPVGALLPQTGAGQLSGTTTEAALRIATDDANRYYQTIGVNVRIRLLVEDTQTDPAMALEKLKTLYNKGVRLVIGPYSSAEAAACKSFIDEKGILMVSQSSESTSLAIAGDNLFRLVPTVAKQAEAMVKLMGSDTITAVASLVRNDVWGIDLLQSFSSAFIPGGGIIAEPVIYEPETTDFSSALNLLNDRVTSLLASFPERRIGIYLISFSEGETILSEAITHASLDRVRWYGSSSFAQNQSVLINEPGAQFALDHNGLPSPVLGLEEAAKNTWDPLIKAIREETGEEADIFSLVAYDILWLAAQTFLVSDYTSGIDHMKEAFFLQADHYYGATGRTSLDSNGDRAFGNFDFWAIRKPTQNFDWKRIAVYNTASGILIRF